jgi:hypothetical protein
MTRTCFRCWRVGAPMHRMTLVDVDVARELAGTSHVYVCNDCLLAWRALAAARPVYEPDGLADPPPEAWGSDH